MLNEKERKRDVWSYCIDSHSKSKCLVNLDYSQMELCKKIDK